MNLNHALLIVDAQMHMFNENISVYQANQLIKTLQKLVKQARLRGVPVIWVRNNGGKGDPDEPGTHGWEINPIFEPNKAEIVIDKHKPSAFKGTNLMLELEQKNNPFGNSRNANGDLYKLNCSTGCRVGIQGDYS